jgi:hypothetical protein
MKMARSYYATALATTNSALGSPNLALLDVTLLSVLLLSTFEALTFQGRASPQSWNAHVSGATALLELRGEKQLEDHLGQQLFHHASMIIWTSRVQRAVQVPPQLERIQQRASTVIGSKRWAIVELDPDIKEHLPSDLNDALGVPSPEMTKLSEKRRKG